MKRVLVENDIKFNRIWGENFSAGFPDDDKQKKSQLRFINQFIGYTTSQGEGAGALSDFGFVSIFENKIYFTQAGLQFAQLVNPIIDVDPMSDELFNEFEQEFIIEYLKNNLKREWEGVRSILKWIHAGNNSPETLNEKIKTLDAEGKWTINMINTMRTGFLGRMNDLKLTFREKIGNKSVYYVTDYGKKVGDING